MKQLYFNDTQAKQEILTLFKASRLIPFFGSGFTMNSRAKRSRVPDAENLTKIIKSAILEKIKDPNLQQEINEIKDLKTAFGLLKMPDLISNRESRTLLENIFSEVELGDESKQKVLKIDWPHIFTFNIDDAIEKVVKNKYKVLVPNKKTSREYISSHKCIFKLHGDISELCAYDDMNLVFTWRDYAHSIENNKAILSFLKDEAQDSSFLFIGCSLDAELDLINLTKDTSFSKSIYLKKGKASLADIIKLKEYGIEKVIYFDTYTQIYEWIYSELKGYSREIPTRDLLFNDTLLSRNEAITIITNGGPVSKIIDDKRVALSSATFPNRTLIKKAAEIIREKNCLLITGRRISGKTLFIFQLAMHLKEFGVTFFSSTDSYDPSIRKKMERLESHLFIFDSNFLSFEGIKEVLYSKIQPSSKIIICASSGDAEQVRFLLTESRVIYDEVTLNNVLDANELEKFNEALDSTGLPICNKKENLLTYAYRCYEEYKHSLPTSTIFDKQFSVESYYLFILISAYGKANLHHIKSIAEDFDINGFIQKNDRLFEIEVTVTGEKVVICNTPTWLLKKVRLMVDNNPDAASIISRVIISLERSGFSSLATDLFRFDKLNELSGDKDPRAFIKDVYINISNVYSKESHYWLQRAKTELISGRVENDINEGVNYARKVRLDNASQKNKTYYSATLVLTQLLARGFTITSKNEFLMSFIDSCIESISNYHNNRRHIDDMAAVNDVRNTLRYLKAHPPIEALPQKEKIIQLCNFFCIE
ncbi:AVAST type 5 anti-phage protein Avs5 [Aeromonas hydrophila]|uniref:AVAST type 5 anti-phage protein Avs5 n=1 Tax=Aeromonas TaxID=642 RepID=UPI002B4A5350|nr:AVAST type 5 anti-phage protein Avs5 [Aeromonas hydrophila]